MGRAMAPQCWTRVATQCSTHMCPRAGLACEPQVWDSRSREMAAHLKLHGGRVSSVAILADNAHVVRTRVVRPQPRTAAACTTHHTDDVVAHSLARRGPCVPRA